MAVTFAVDDFVRAPQPLPTRRLADALGEALTAGGDLDRPVVDHGPTHALLGAVHLAFAEHRPLVLSPDAVWLTIARGVAQHVQLHAEELRPRLVRHAGTKTLQVECGPAMPADPASWTAIVAQFRERVAGEIGDGRARLLECDFSTTTDVERTAGRITLMDVYAPYFDFELMCVCGIPEITLLGTVEDWQKIRARVDVVGELGLETWARSLAAIADHLVRAAAGDADVAFWKRIYKPRDVYGGAIVTGWIARLYPYLEEDGRVATPNPLLELPIDRPRGGDADDEGRGIRTSQVSGLPSTAPITVVAVGGRREEVALDGGVLAVAQDETGRLAPICGWVLRRSKARIAAVIERIRAAYPFVPAPPRDRRTMALNLSGPADFIGLYSELEEATLFDAGHRWRIRPPGAHERIGFDLGLRWPTTVVRFIDLDDGTFIGRADLPRGATAFVRARGDRVEAIPDDGSPRVEDRRSTQPPSEVPVLRGRLSEILAVALDSHGVGEPAALGTLADTVVHRG